jgi:hypothetical protein
MTENIEKQGVLKSGILFLAVFALAKLALHLVTNTVGGFGIFRDELYYLACADRLALGYVDQPPLSIFVLAGVKGSIGSSLFAIRLLPAFFGSAVVFLTGLIARELGGKRFAQAVAMLASIVSIIHLAFSGIYSMNVFDLFFWALTAFLLIRLIKSERNSLWIWIGVVLGLGLLNKISVLWLGVGLAIGLIFSGQRKWLKTRWPYAAAVTAGILFLPYVVWNLTHDLAHLEFMRNASAYKYSGLNILDFLMGQILLPNPVSLPVWLGGLFFLFFHKKAKPYRLLGFLFLVPLVILVINQHSKPEYLAAAYAVPFAAGGVFFEGLFSRKRLGWLKPVLVVFMAAGFVMAPYVVPILSQETTIAYLKTLGIETPNSEGKEVGTLPQHYADMHGWENMARIVSEVYLSLPSDEREVTVVYGQNYGEAAAVDYYRKKYELPRAVSGHNSYWMWGFPDDIETVIIIGGSLEQHASYFNDVRQAAFIQSLYVMPYENDLPVYIGRDLKAPLTEIWNQIKNYN